MNHPNERNSKDRSVGGGLNEEHLVDFPLELSLPFHSDSQDENSDHELEVHREMKLNRRSTRDPPGDSCAQHDDQSPNEKSALSHFDSDHERNDFQVSKTNQIGAKFIDQVNPKEGTLLSPRSSSSTHESLDNSPSDMDDEITRATDQGSVHSKLCIITTPPQSPPPSKSEYEMSLEQRVNELEEKLATLARLVKPQLLNTSTTKLNILTKDADEAVTPSSIEEDFLFESPEWKDRKQRANGIVPYLESPTPHQMGGLDSRQTKRLSFHLLYDGDSKKYNDLKKLEAISDESESCSGSTEDKATPNESAMPMNDSSEKSDSAKDITKPLIESPPKRTVQALSSDRKSKWLQHLNSIQESNDDVDELMQEFIKVPGAVEKCLLFGFCICVDSFLYVVTVLPIRFLWSCMLLLVALLKWNTKPSGPYCFHRRHMYPIIQIGIIFFVYRFVLLPISIGKVYHWIRGQAMIKLYVITSLAEVFDRLMCALGQDCMDSMYWNTTRHPGSSRWIISILVVVAYTTVHSLVLFAHAATINVAMNSADEALIALLIGGNFSEIRSTVFKKFNKASLFKVTSSDINERFKLVLFLGLVLLLNVCQGSSRYKMGEYLRMCLLVYGAEIISDWLKHAFISKFNFIPSAVYNEYGLLLAGDVTGIGHEDVNLDHSHAVVKRLGFSQVPLVCVFIRLLREAFKYVWPQIQTETPFLLGFVGLGIWSILFLIKVLLGTYLQRISLDKLHASPMLSQTPMKPGKSKTPSSKAKK